MPQTDEAVFYQLYFQTPGVAEKEFERDVRSTFRSLLGAGAAEQVASTTGNRNIVGMVPRSGGFLAGRVNPGSLPSWLTEADIEFYTSEFSRTGFRGGLNWYRNIDRNWELLGSFAGKLVTVPALYVAGDRDLVVRFPRMDQLISNLSKFVPKLRQTIMLPDCAHWTQQERPEEVNAAIIGLLRNLN